VVAGKRDGFQGLEKRPEKFPSLGTELALSMSSIIFEGAAAGPSLDLQPQAKVNT
jgi:hypothetical protein